MAFGCLTKFSCAGCSGLNVPWITIWFGREDPYTFSYHSPSLDSRKTSCTMALRKGN